MKDNETSTGYQGNIAEANKSHFPQAIQEAFDFMEVSPDAEFFTSKNDAAQIQFDKKTARSTLQKLDSTCSLKDALASVLAQLPDERDDEYVRTFVQWFITEFEAATVVTKTSVE